MKVCATNLLKELKALQSEIYEIYEDDKKSSMIPVDRETLQPKFEVEYSYAKNRKRLEGLYARERKVRNALSVFNSTQKVDGFELTIEEGLVRIAQLRKEIAVLKTLSERKKFTSDGGYGLGSVEMVNYSIDQVKADLKEKNAELSALQISIDRTNLTVMFEIN